MDEITLRLEVKVLDYIVQVLATRPWGEVNPVMENIKQQVQGQGVAPKPNGTDKQEDLWPH